MKKIGEYNLYLLVILLSSICMIKSVDASAPSNAKKVCTYTFDTSDSLTSPEYSGKLEIWRRKSGKNADAGLFEDKRWGATYYYISKKNSVNYDIEASGRWHGTWDAWSNDYECPKYAAWAIQKHPGTMGVPKIYVHFGKSREALEGQLKDMYGHGIAIVKEDSIAEEELKNEEKICEGRSLAEGIGTTRGQNITFQTYMVSLKSWYNAMDELDNNNCFDFDVNVATLGDWSTWRKVCQPIYTNFFTGDKGKDSFSTELSARSKVPDIKDAIAYMKELGCVKDTDIVYNGDTLAQSVAKIDEYYDKAEKNFWKLSCKHDGSCVVIPEDSDDKYNGELFCGIFGEGTFGFIKSIYTVIKILIPVLIIVLGIIDFLKVVFSGEEKDMKASGTRFLKRIIAGIIFILLPALILFLFNIVGFSEDCIQQLIK